MNELHVCFFNDLGAETGSSEYILTLVNNTAAHLKIGSESGTLSECGYFSFLFSYLMPAVAWLEARLWDK